jgi:hypothetical protein
MRQQIIIEWDPCNRGAGIEVMSTLMQENAKLPAEVLDFGIMCEGLVQMIHALENSKIQKSDRSLRQAIAHLENGFSDTRFDDVRVIEPEDDKPRTYS